MKYGLAVGILCCMFAMTTGVARAQIGADLNLSPKRVVMGPTDRTATVFVYNRGTTPARYSLDMIDRAMMADGDIVDIQTLQPGPELERTKTRLKSAKPMLIFTPRRVTLGAGESQIVRIRALRPPGLETGEYRTSLTVTALPPEDSGFTAEQAATLKQGEVSMRISSLFSLAIPVIVRQGTVNASARITSPKLTGSGITATLIRQGGASLYGTLEAHRNHPGGELLGAVRGLGIYTEVESRTTDLQLSPLPKSGDRIVLIFRDEDQKPGEILATELLIVP